jgi:hypothetical protein
LFGHLRLVGVHLGAYFVYSFTVCFSIGLHFFWLAS